MRFPLEREPAARVLGIRLLDRLDGVLQAIDAAVRRHLDHEPDVEVAGLAALRVTHPASAEAEPLAALAALRDFETDGAAPRRRHVDRRATHRLADRDGHLEREILPAPLHERMRTHLHAEVEIARRATTPRAALSPHADARAIRDARRDLHREPLALLDRTRAPAARAATQPLAPGPL